MTAEERAKAEAQVIYEEEEADEAEVAREEAEARGYNVLRINPMDRGESRRTFLQTLHQMKATLPKEAFRWGRRIACAKYIRAEGGGFEPMQRAMAWYAKYHLVDRSKLSHQDKIDLRLIKVKKKPALISNVAERSEQGASKAEESVEDPSQQNDFTKLGYTWADDHRPLIVVVVIVVALIVWHRKQLVKAMRRLIPGSRREHGRNRPIAKV